MEAASDHQKGIRPNLSAESSPAPPPQAASTGVVKTSSTTTSTKTVHQSVSVKKCATGMVNPINKPPKSGPMSVLSMRYNPEESATWQAVNESENCQLVSEHGPTESKVYSI